MDSNCFSPANSLSFLRLPFFNHYLSCGQSRDGNPEGRSTDIVHAEPVAELDAVRITAVLAADADFQLGPGLAPLFDSPAHQHAYPFDIEGLKWIRAEYSGLLFVHVVGKKAARIVAGETHGGLREVVGTKGEEFSDLRDLGGQQSSAREFDHGTNEVVQLDAEFLRELFLFLPFVGDELVEWRIDQANGDREAVHGLEDTDEVAALEREQAIESLDASFFIVGKDHFLNGALALVALLREFEI